MARTSIASMPRKRLGVDLNKCINFSLSNSVVTFTAPTSFNPANITQFTAAVWIFPRSIGATAGRILECSNGGSGHGFLMLVNANKTLTCQVAHTVANASVLTGAGSLPYGQWQRVLFTWSDADNTPTVYINGVAAVVGTPTNKSGTRTNMAGDTCYVGNNNANTRNFDGLIDEVCIWNRVLTAKEIIDDYNNADTPTSGLILRYQMDEASGNLTDSSASALTGTPSNVTQNVTSYSVTRTTAASQRQRLGINLNKCCTFNSSTSKISFTVPASFDPSTLTAFTCAAWIQMTSYGGSNNGRICDFERGSGKGWSWNMTKSNGHLVDVNHSVANARTVSGLTAAAAKLNLWQRVLFTWSDADNIPVLYINGIAAPVESSTNKSGVRNTFSGDTVKLGNRFSADDRALGGNMDEFCVWNRVLTAAEIRSDYDTAFPPSSGLIMRYQMDEASGNLTDSIASIVGTPSNVTQNVASYAPTGRTAA